MRAVVDRIEGHIAVLLFGDEEIKVDLPVKYLPKGVKEGHHLEVGFKIDQAATDAQQEKVRGLMEELLKRGKERVE